MAIYYQATKFSTPLWAFAALAGDEAYHTHWLCMLTWKGDPVMQSAPQALMIISFSTSGLATAAATYSVSLFHHILYHLPTSADWTPLMLIVIEASMVWPLLIRVLEPGTPFWYGSSLQSWGSMSWQSCTKVGKSIRTCDTVLIWF